jgi:hypothetical protein
VRRNRLITTTCILAYLSAVFTYLRLASSEVSVLSILLVTAAIGVIAVVVFLITFGLLTRPESRVGRLGWLLAGVLAAILWFSLGRSSYRPVIWFSLLLLVPILSAWVIILLETRKPIGRRPPHQGAL